MKSKLFAVLGAIVVFLLVSSTLLAHHAGTLYDREHPVTLKGTVTQFVFTNPHAQIHRSEEHTSELQSQSNLVCRLLLEKKKKKQIQSIERRHIDRYMCTTNRLT